MSALVAVILLAAAGPTSTNEAVHAKEIRIFATTMAIAKTVKVSCPAIKVDDFILEALRQRLHMVDADRPAFAPQAHEAADALECVSACKTDPLIGVIGVQN